MSNFAVNVKLCTERFLTWRKKRRFVKKEKEKQKNPILDWIESFIWAAAVVFLLNQYLFQAYAIPTPSMVDTLKVKDRLFVNKMIYGPEIIPGRLKTSTGIVPKRNEVIIFESPTYLSKGSVFDIAQRLIYMLTFSLVDIDRDSGGNPKPHFLIKRAMALEEDQIRIINGEVEIKAAGFTDWMDEKDFKKIVNKNYKTRRLFKQEDYEAIKAYAFIDVADYTGIEANIEWQKSYSAKKNPYLDNYSWQGYRAQAKYQINPHLHEPGSDWRKSELGWYIPKGWIFPMGDNRDNSKDGRYFGPVSLKKVLGRASFIYWPVSRISVIR